MRLPPGSFASQQRACPSPFAVRVAVLFDVQRSGVYSAVQRLNNVRHRPLFVPRWVAWPFDVVPLSSNELASVLAHSRLRYAKFQRDGLRCGVGLNQRHGCLGQSQCFPCGHYYAFQYRTKPTKKANIRKHSRYKVVSSATTKKNFIATPRGRRHRCASTATSTVATLANVSTLRRRSIVRGTYRIDSLGCRCLRASAP